MNTARRAYLLTPDLERRQDLLEPTQDAPQITGYGAVFYNPNDPTTEYRLWDDTYERIAPTAFDDAIALAQDAPAAACFNHDPNFVLGRQPQTLDLARDATGLRYTITPPDTQIVRDLVLAPIQRRDVAGASVMFSVLAERWEKAQRDGRDITVRTIERAILYEIGPVTFPAYSATTADARSHAEALSSHKTWIANQLPDLAARARLRLRLRAALARAHRLPKDTVRA